MLKKLVTSLLFSLAYLYSTAQDSCSCGYLRPLPSTFGIGILMNDHYSTITNSKPYTGICHNYYMKVAYVTPDYSRTLEYARFKDGALSYYLKMNPQNDTYIVFRMINKDSIIAEERRGSYGNHNPSARGLYYYSKGKKLILWNEINSSGNYYSVAHYFYPSGKDTLNYHSLGHNYATESVLQRDGFYNIPVCDGAYDEYSLKDSVHLTHGYYHNNYKSGHWTAWYPDGQLQADGSYALNYEWKDGEWKEWYPNGQIKSDIEYCNSNPCGKEREWYENGQLKRSADHTKVPFKNGYRFVTTGELIEYYANGQMKHRARFDNEYQQTTDERWYENGQQQTFISYGKDQVNRSWFENGQLQSEENYLDGKPSSPWTEYYDNGKLKHYVQYESYAIRNGKEEYYYENGQLRTSAYFEHGVQRGKYRTYYPNGQQQSEEQFDGIKSGPATYWDENGKQRSFINWKQMQWDGECTFYYPNGKIWRKGNYKAGVRDGKFSEWDLNGNLIYEQDYINGNPQSKKKFVSPAKANVDSLKKVYAVDIPKTACMITIDPESPYHHLVLPSDSLTKAAANTIISAAMFSILDDDSAIYVHFDSSCVTHVYLDYPWYPKRSGDTSRCKSAGSWPPQLDDLIKHYKFKPVFDECYGDDHGGIRRGFTSEILLNAQALDSVMRKMNPKYGCEPFYPNQWDRNDDRSRIDGYIKGNIVYLEYYYFPYKGNRSNYYIYYNFAIYPDGSADLLNEEHQYFFYYTPE